jgi:hypothetical protein
MSEKKWLIINLEFTKIFLFLFLVNYSFAGNGKISLEAKVDKNKIKIGDLIQYSIIVARDENINIEMPDLGANLGAFEIRDYNDLDPEKQNGEIVQRREYTISTYDVGDYEIPPVTVRYSVGKDTAWKELTTETIKITVESLKPSEAGDIRDIKAPLEIERNWMRIIRFVAAGLIIVLIGILIFVYFKRRKEGKSLLPHREKPKRPPHEIALEELEQLLQQQLLEKGEIKQFYIRISEIIRRYVEGRFFIVAIEMTTSQLIDTMIEAEVEKEDVQLVEDFLMQCDLVKFAKYMPTSEEHQKVIDQAFEIVNKTKIIIEPETTATVDVESKKEEQAETVEMSEETEPVEKEVV